jgi:putative SOS response-associated peptidase YedK
MCGRTSQFFTWADVYAFSSLLPARAPTNLPPRYNISPTEPIGVITVGNDGAWTYQDMRWWLVPSWWKKPLKEVPATFNARAETVADKPMFRGAFQSRRCLIPVSGFNEWTGPKDSRQPWFISAADGKPLTLAGLYERWKNPETGESIMGCSIVVMGANKFMGEIHDRMPVIIEEADREAWLAEPRLDLLRQVPEDHAGVEGDAKDELEPLPGG